MPYSITKDNPDCSGWAVAISLATDEPVDTARQSALEKLSRLGLTEEEIQALLGK